MTQEGEFIPMCYGSGRPNQNAEAVYEALNASYRMLDEYMRQGQQFAEDTWLPWAGPFFGNASPFIPPEQWIRAYGEVAMAWMAMAQAWTSGWSRWSAMGPQNVASPTPFTREAEGVPHAR